MSGSALLSFRQFSWSDLLCYSFDEETALGRSLQVHWLLASSVLFVVSTLQFFRS